MSEIIFKSKEELYKRSIPALRSKKEEGIRLGDDHLKEEDIWNYLQESLWTKSNNLTLSDIINDILNVSFEDVNNYYINLYKEETRSVNLEDIDII